MLIIDFDQATYSSRFLQDELFAPLRVQDHSQNHSVCPLELLDGIGASTAMSTARQYIYEW